MEKKAIQKVGDRNNPTLSIKDYAFCVNANPMSDRQQLVLEIKDEKDTPIPHRQRGERKDHSFGVL